MQVTDVRIKKVTFTGAAADKENKLKATCSVVFDESFVVHDLRVVEGIKGLFVAMPRKKTGEGEYRDQAHPITAQAREHIQQAVLAAYQELEQKETAVL